VRTNGMDRRGFLGALGAGFLTSKALEAAEAVGPTKITKIEAVRFRDDLQIKGIKPNWMWVRLHTDSGLIGIGESYPGYDAHRGALQELAQYVIGRDPTRIERLSGLHEDPSPRNVFTGFLQRSEEGAPRPGISLRLDAGDADGDSGGDPFIAPFELIRNRLGHGPPLPIQQPATYRQAPRIGLSGESVRVPIHCFDPTWSFRSGGRFQPLG